MSGAPRNSLGRMRRKKYTNFATKPAKSSLPAETAAILPSPSVICCTASLAAN
jgi:hypothetical protein